MLLRKSEWSSLPVGHLFTLAHFLVKQMFRHLSEATLIGRNANFAVVSLSIDKVSEQLVKLHRWEMPSKDVQVTLERKSNAEGLRVGENFSEDVIELGAGCQSY